MTIFSQIYHLHKNFFKRSSTGRNNKEETGTSNGIYSAKGQNLKSTVFGFQQDVMIASYCPKKKPSNQYVFNKHSHSEIESALDQKPSIILFYNKTKGGVDTLNRIIRSYSTKRMT